MTHSAPAAARATVPAAARPTDPALPPTPPADGVPGTSPRPAGTAPTPELGGPKGLEPTRYGDWERDGRCVDF